MKHVSKSVLLISLLTAGCGGGSSSAPPADDPADTPIPEPVEVIEADTGATPPGNDTAAGESAGAAATPEDEEGAVADDNTASAQPQAPEEPPPSSDLQTYVNATTGYTPEYRTVMDNMDTFKQCYLDAIRANPDLSGMLKVRFTVLKSGKVKKAKATQNELNEQVAKCVINALKKIKFPRRANKRTVEYPFKFVPSPS
jgi:hypothetical protein